LVPQNTLKKALLVRITKFSVTLIFSLMSLSHSLNQHSVTRTMIFLSRPALANILQLCGFTNPANAGTRNPRRTPAVLIQ